MGKMMLIIKTITDWKKIRKSIPPENSMGFVPTMGALHEGHLSLVDKSVQENDLTVASIFVNPSQFNDSSDLEKYPRDFNSDAQLLESRGVYSIFFPEVGEMYPNDYRYRITENEKSKIMEGAHRPGHFDGVFTVVMKLLNLVKPTRAYFGKKDYQQLILIRDMVSSFFLDVEIVGCPTIRENDGLAMSSRNTLLTMEERAKAPDFSKALQSEKFAENIKTDLTELGFDVDYIEEHNGRKFGAVTLGKVRLIDNVKL
jgi:pantoate--beta-alanine ligase